MKYTWFKVERIKSAWVITVGGGMLLTLLLSGCSRVTQENYAKLKVGMEYAAVVAILGEPVSCSSVLNATNCTWGNEKRSIDISLVADKVVFLTSSGL